MTLPANRQLYRFFMEQEKAGHSASKEMLLGSVAELKDAETLGTLLAKWQSVVDPVGEAEKLVDKLSRAKAQDRAAEIYALLADPGLDETTKANLKKELNDISKGKTKDAFRASLDGLIREIYAFLSKE